MSITREDLMTIRSIMAKVESEDELQRIRTLFIESARDFQTKTARNFMVGDTVEFKGKFGVMVSGKIMKVNRKSIKVNAGEQGVWNVSPSLLTLVD